MHLNRLRKVLSLVLLAPLGAVGADWHVLEGGSGDGTTWSSPLGTLAAAETAASRGDTIWIGDGSYAGATLNTADSGTTVITIKKATAAAHGSATGWDNAYGDGVASFTSGVNFYSSYWVFDGVSGGGPDGWTAGHGFSFAYDTPDTYDYRLVMRSVTGITIAHVNLGPASQDSPGYDVAVYVPGTYSAANVTISYCYIHHMGDQGMSMVCDGLTIEYCRFDYIGGYELGGNHGNGIEMRHGNDLTFRYNLCSNWEASGFLGLYGDTTPADATGWIIHGNVFFISGAVEQGDIIYMTGTTNALSNSVIANNTFYGLTAGRVVDLDGAACENNVFKNNVVFGTNGSYSTVGMTFDYNASDDALVGDSNLVSIADDPFVNVAGEDFSLVEGAEPIDAATNLGAPYNVDWNGTTHNEIGALAFDAGGDPPSSAPTTLAATVVWYNGATFTWADNSDDEASFRLERSPHGAATWTAVATFAADAETGTVTDQPTGTDFDWRLFAVSATGQLSDPTNTVNQPIPAISGVSAPSRAGGAAGLW